MSRFLYAIVRPRHFVIGKISAVLALLSAASADNLRGQVAQKLTGALEKTFMHEVTGEFDVNMTPVDTADEKVGMMTLDKQYRGALVATGKGRMLATMNDAKDSGAYVAMERVSGKLKGAEGTFVIHHTGVMNKGTNSLSIRVAPDSGTGDLNGIEGVMHITIENKKHFYRLEYSLPTMGATAK